jgi:hypothetical protein
MANFVFNNGKGRVRELVERVDTNDPADAKILLVPLAVGDSEANLQDSDTLSAVLAGTPDRAGGSWGDKTLTDANFTGTDYDTNDTDNRGDASVPSVTWTAPTGGQNTVALIVCYTEVASPADSDWIPITYHDFVVTADGNDVVLNAGDFFRAS